MPQPDLLRRRACLTRSGGGAHKWAVADPGPTPGRPTPRLVDHRGARRRYAPNDGCAQAAKVMREPAGAPRHIVGMAWIGAHARKSNEVHQLGNEPFAMIPHVRECSGHAARDRWRVGTSDGHPAHGNSFDP